MKYEMIKVCLDHRKDFGFYSKCIMMPTNNVIKQDCHWNAISSRCCWNGADVREHSNVFILFEDKVVSQKEIGLCGI